MLDPTRLFTWEPHIDQRRIRADTLVVTLGSYLDAGHAQRLVDDRLLDQLPNRVLGRFDADQLIDYGGRRPEIVFDRDHFDSYAKPEIALHLVTDTTCDWPFYEHLGLERLGARPGSGGTTHPDEYFLYGTRL